MKKYLSDALLLIGLAILGVGVYINYGIGSAAIVDGSIILTGGFMLAFKG